MFTVFGLHPLNRLEIDMDTSKTKAAEDTATPSRQEILKARIIVVAAIESVSDCYRPDISKAAGGRVSETALSKAISELVKEGVIRMKECPYEHDWEYRINPI